MNTVILPDATPRAYDELLAMPACLPARVTIPAFEPFYRAASDAEYGENVTLSSAYVQVEVFDGCEVSADVVIVLSETGTGSQALTVKHIEGEGCPELADGLPCNVISNVEATPVE